MATRRVAWDTLVTWVHAHGGALDARLCYDDARDCDGGIKASEQLNVDSSIIEIPMSLWVTRAAAESSAIGREAASAINSAVQAGIQLQSGSPADIIIAFHLAADVAINSFHAPYYATLPTGEDDPRVMLPRCWSDAEIDALLGGSPAAGEAKRARAAVASDYEAVSAHIEQHSLAEWPDFEAYDWAMAMVGSRSFCLDTSAGPVDALIPALDMLNHARPRETSYQVVEDRGDGVAEGTALHVRVLRPVVANRALHITYGAKGNAQLLGSYGFVTLVNYEPDGSSNDVRDLYLPQPAALSAPAPLVHVPSTHAPLRIGPKGYAFPALNKAVDAFRAVAFAQWRSSAADHDTKLEGIALEVRALRALRDAIDTELAGYALKSEEAAAAALHAPPKPPKAVRKAPGYRADLWARRAASAAALVLSELLTLGWYRTIVCMCLTVLSPPASDEGGGGGGVAASKADQRRARAIQLQDDVRAERERAERERAERERAAVATRDEQDASPVESPVESVEALRRYASRAHAADTALVFLKIRFPALSAQPTTKKKRKRTVD